MPKKPAKITIIENGPYLVEGNIPLTEQQITPKGQGYVYQKLKNIEHEETYILCRCGHTKTPPFCDGAHAKAVWHGTETAS